MAANKNRMGTGCTKREAPIRSRTQMKAALTAHDRILAISTEIRARHGLDPVPDGDRVRVWRARLSEGSTRQADLSGTERVADLAKRREKLKRDEKKLDRELRELVASREVPVSRIAAALGVSRQRIYQLAPA